MRTTPWIVLLLVGLVGLNTPVLESGPHTSLRPPLGPQWQVSRSLPPFFYLTAFACTVAAVGGLANALRRPRRPRPPWICPTCGYDCRATPTRCPECGTLRP